MKHHWINRTSIKTVILSIFPIGIGALCSMLGNWDPQQQWFVGKLLLLIIWGIIYIVLLCYYAKNDTNLKCANDILTRQNDALKKAASFSGSICKKSAEAFNSFAHSITDESKIDMNIWSFDKAMMWVCEAVYELVCKISDGDDFGVSYVKLLEDHSLPHHVKTVAFHNASATAPHVQDKVRDIEDRHGYFDTKIFAQANPDVVTIDTPKAVYESFEFENKKDKMGKYSQYIGFPVICDNNKIIGLIQVVSYHESKIAKSSKELEAVAKKYLSQFVFMAVFLAKAEKGLLSMPNLSVKGRSK